jgi:hypothetical protein
MGPAQIHVNFQGGRLEEGFPCYEPGAPISGTVDVRPVSDLKCNHLYVRLQWHTEGRATRDEGKAGELDVYQGPLSAGLPVSYSYRFVLPREPWSYTGHYVNIVWEVFVELDIPWAGNARHGQRFVMAPEWRRHAPDAVPELFDVVLLEGGKNLALVTRILKVVVATSQGAGGGMLSTSLPTVLLSGVSDVAAQEAKRQLEKAGATVEVRPRTGS